MNKIVDKILILVSPVSVEFKLDILKTLQTDEWHELVNISERSFLIPFLYECLSEPALYSKIPDTVRKELHERNQRMSIRNLKVKSVFIEIVRILNREKIEFIVLKGCDIQHRLYRHPSLRPMIDVDILFHPEDIERVTQLITNLGGKKTEVSESTFIDALKHHEAPLIFKNVAVEFHKSIVDQYDTTDLGKIDLWNCTEFTDIEKYPVRVMQPEILLIYLCHHLFSTLQGGKIKLFWYVDIMLFFQVFGNRLDEKKLKTLINIGKEQEIVSKIISQTQGLFPETPVPVYLKSDAVIDKTEIYNALFTSVVRKPLPHYIDKFKNIKGIRNRIQFIVDKLFPSIAYVKEIYKPRSGFQLTLNYLGHIFLIILLGSKSLFIFLLKQLKR